MVAALTGLMAASAAAHHSFSAEYDSNKPLKLTGKVVEMKWSNPHAWIYIDVAGADGKVVNWALETGGANTLFRRGWRKEDLPPDELLAERDIEIERLNRRVYGKITFLPIPLAIGNAEA